VGGLVVEGGLVAVECDQLQEYREAAHSTRLGHEGGAGEYAGGSGGRGRGSGGDCGAGQRDMCRPASARCMRQHAGLNCVPIPPGDTLATSRRPWEQERLPDRRRSRGIAAAGRGVVRSTGRGDGGGEAATRAARQPVGAAASGWVRCDGARGMCARRHDGGRGWRGNRVATAARPRHDRVSKGGGDEALSTTWRCAPQVRALLSLHSTPARLHGVTEHMAQSELRGGVAAQSSTAPQLKTQRPHCHTHRCCGWWRRQCIAAGNA